MRRYLAFVIVLFPFFANAACSLNTSDSSMLQSPQKITMPLNHPVISIGEDLPVGSVLYEQTSRSGLTPYRISCTTAAGNFTVVRKIDIAPKPLSTYSDATYKDVYETGIPGIGIAIWSNTRKTWPYEEPICSTGLVCTVSNPYGVNAFIITLIKTGNISPGVIDASNFPTVSVNIGKAAENLVKGYTFSLSGVMTIVSPTCVTPDYNVSLGTWSSALFTAKGVSTPWVDASITLTNCTKSTGYFPSGTNIWSDVSTNVNVGSLTINKWNLKLAPLTAIEDSANGIFANDTSVANHATGLSIQIGSSQPDVADSHLMNFNTVLNGNLSSAGGTLIIPLSARMIQTADQVSGGSVNGKIVYTLSYL